MSLMDMVRGMGRAAEGGKAAEGGRAAEGGKAAEGMAAEDMDIVAAVGKGILHILGRNSPFLFLLK